MLLNNDTLLQKNRNLLHRIVMLYADKDNYGQQRRVYFRRSQADKEYLRRTKTIGENTNSGGKTPIMAHIECNLTMAKSLSLGAIIF